MDEKGNGLTSAETREEITRSLRLVFPHGHEDFLPTIVAQMELHSLKNHDYAKDGSALGNFERVSAILALYPGLNLGDKRVVALVYALKQLDAVLWGLAKNITHKVEGLVDRLNDIAVYSNIVICMIKGDARGLGCLPQAASEHYCAATVRAGTGRIEGSTATNIPSQAAETEPQYQKRMGLDDAKCSTQPKGSTGDQKHRGW